MSCTIPTYMVLYVCAHHTINHLHSHLPALSPSSPSSSLCHSSSLPLFFTIILPPSLYPSFLSSPLLLSTFLLSPLSPLPSSPFLPTFPLSPLLPSPQAGANMIVSSTAVVRSPDPQKVITELRTSIEKWLQVHANRLLT